MNISIIVRGKSLSLLNSDLTLQIHLPRPKSTYTIRWMLNDVLNTIVFAVWLCLIQIRIQMLSEKGGIVSREES